jgi:4-aminobutyrate aminotransferase
VELVASRKTKEPAPARVEALVDRAFRKGLLVLGCGKSTLRLAPPLIIDEEDVEIAVGIIDEALGEIEGATENRSRM